MVNELVSGTKGASFDVGVPKSLEPAAGGVELKWPQEGVSLFEMWTASVNLVDEVLEALDSKLT